MSESTLPCVEVEPSAPAERAVIWLHGLGADGHDFEPLVPYLRLEGAPPTRFVFPHAPSIPVSINMGAVMPAWYDISSLDLRKRHDERGILRSDASLRALVARENARGIAARHVLLAGFSQGGAIALHTALRYPERLAGVLALSTYLVRGDALEDERSEANRGLSVFHAHGTHDPMVDVERGRAAAERLRALGYDVRFKTYPMGHEVHPSEIMDIGRFIRDALTGGRAEASESR